MPKMHLLRSTRSTWCGLDLNEHPNLNVMRGIGTGDLKLPNCKSCTKADAAETRRNEQ